MTKIKATYLGDLRVQCVHQSGATLQTDAPKDNHGKGENFSPTDLLPTALASCMLTLMGISAKKLGLSLEGSSIDAEKEMVDGPRRIGKIRIRFSSSFSPTPEAREKLEQAARSCPVHYSLHPDIAIELTFHWGIKR